MKRAKSGTEGLYKAHTRGCPNATGADPTRCRCAWRGRYGLANVALAVWAGVTVDPRTKGKAQEVLGRLRVAVDGEVFDPAGERQSLGTGTPLDDIGKDWLASRAKVGKLNTESTALSIAVITDGPLGACTMQHLAEHPEQIEAWLDAAATARGWSDATWVAYWKKLRALFNFAIRKGRVTVNPVLGIELRVVMETAQPYARQLDDVEDALLKACDLFDAPLKPTRPKLTQAQADEIRRRVAAGETQVALARAFRVSAPVVCAVVHDRIWTGGQPRTKGREMRRRVIFAIDSGGRKGEMLGLQVKHVDWRRPRPIEDAQGTFNGYVITLPPELTKGGKSTGQSEQIYVTSRRLSAELDARRMQLRNKPDAYLFGHEDGTQAKGFRKLWQALFAAAGLVVGRDTGVVWHACRHEFGSRVSQQTGGDRQMIQELMRHDDYRTSEKYVHTRDDRKWAAAVGVNRR